MACSNRMLGVKIFFAYNNMQKRFAFWSSPFWSSPLAHWNNGTYWGAELDAEGSELLPAWLHVVSLNRLPHLCPPWDRDTSQSISQSIEPPRNHVSMGAHISKHYFPLLAGTQTSIQKHSSRFWLALHKQSYGACNLTRKPSNQTI